MTRMPEIWGIPEMAAALDVHPRVAAGWTKQPDFPKPRELQMGRIWLAADVRKWRRQKIAARRKARAF